MPHLIIDSIGDGIVTLIFPEGVEFDSNNQHVNVRDDGYKLLEWRGLVVIELPHPDSDVGMARIYIPEAMFSCIGKRYIRAVTELLGVRITDALKKKLEARLLGVIEVARPELEAIVDLVDNDFKPE